MAEQSSSIDFIFTTQAIRQRANQIYQLAKNGGTHFQINEEKLDQVADFVLSIIRQNYPSLEVPYHSRWRHFEVGNRAQLTQYYALTQSMTALQRAKLGFDLIIPSVLVDAGAGPDWQYRSINSHTVGRSEGLALASLDTFLAGGFASNKTPMADARGLAAITEADFAVYFQASDNNPLIGIPGRVQLLKSLGNAIAAQTELFPSGRPGDLVDKIHSEWGTSPAAVDVLALVLQALGQIWPGRISYHGSNLGDTWAYPPLGETPNNLVPFHKLSQWLSYSLIETLNNNGFNVTGVDQLTGLAEYRNGGLMIDSGLIQLRNPTDSEQNWDPASEIIIEWRALTVFFLDKLGIEIQQRLQRSASEFPLAKVLEGGTWAAGRALAQSVRGNLSPPLNINSDATVF